MALQSTATVVVWHGMVLALLRANITIQRMQVQERSAVYYAARQTCFGEHFVLMNGLEHVEWTRQAPVSMVSPV